jgi:Cupin domain
LIFALSRTTHDARHRVEHELDDGTRLVWELLDEQPPDALLSAEVELDSATPWIARCDRVDFPPGGIAYRHTHPGPGIRYLVTGALTIDASAGERTYRAGEAWFEDAGEPVLATASSTEDTAFVRVLLLPREWEGKRTIRYLDPADDERPKLQRATVYLEQPIEL